jgi:UDP-2,4-diacetamido-2,4,6-trideoxy-beta-L-altropyranose hydrolase
MRVVFRTDASLEIGTGHVMRCLTLADALRKLGAHCLFICRQHPGNLIKYIRQRSYEVVELPLDSKWARNYLQQPAQANLLGEYWKTDVEQTKVGIGPEVIDWLIVDHYSLDANWENALASHYLKLMVIDDLADRPHSCDLLLDQTLCRDAADYLPLVPVSCRMLCGSQYALLSPVFSTLRSYSLRRRAQPVLRDLLISMGGVDVGNVTGQVLKALRVCPLPENSRIKVIMGTTAPWQDEIHTQAKGMPWPTSVLVGTGDMAQLMAECDLAIGAAGTTSWERCCLGVPAILFVLAENQYRVAQALERAGAVKIVTSEHNLAKRLEELIIPLIINESKLVHMSACAASVVDGLGVNAVLQNIGV